MWRLAVTADASVAEAYAEALESMAAVVSIYEVAPGPNPGVAGQPEDWATDILMSGQCVIEALFEAPPATEDLTSAIAETAATLRQRLPPLAWGELSSDTDWVTESQAHNPAIRAGAMLVKPSHVEQAPPAPHVIHLDAGRAFGTGGHATTHGCLMLMQRLGQEAQPRRIADIGTGSGLLAIAAAKLYRRAHIVASEIDAQALGGRSLQRPSQWRADGVCGCQWLAASYAGSRRAIRSDPSQPALSPTHALFAADGQAVGARRSIDHSRSVVRPGASAGAALPQLRTYP